MTDHLAVLEGIAEEILSDPCLEDNATYYADKITAAIALMRGQSWQPISEAPVCDFIEKEAPKCLVYGKGVGVHMGRAWRYPGGEAKAQAFGFHGDWPLTHFCNLPSPPKDTADE